MDNYQRKKVLITVKTYPTPANKGGEVSCTAGITDSGEWIRLYPIPYRFLHGFQQFKKYQWVQVDTIKSSSDPRKESYKVNADTIKVISEPMPTYNEWEERKKIVLPLKAPSLCYLQNYRRETGNTLGIFKPKVIRQFIIEPVPGDWEPEEYKKLSQYSFNCPKWFKPLEKIPYKFSYSFTCDDPECTGHQLSCVDWELSQTYRSWKQAYDNNALKSWDWALKNKFETELVLKRDTHFIVGTIHGHPGAWIIIGLFYPPKQRCLKTSDPFLN